MALPVFAVGPGDYKFVDGLGAAYAASSPASKTRTHDFGGTTPLVSGGATGLATCEYNGITDTATTIEGNVVTTNGLQSIAGGRIAKLAGGGLRRVQYAADALVSGAPRVQIAGWPFYGETAFKREMRVKFGDATTPWPAYVANKSSCLIWQIKTPASGNPVLQLTAYQAGEGSLNLALRWKPTAAGSAATIVDAFLATGLALGTFHDIVIEGFLSPRPVRGVRPWLRCRVNGQQLPALRGATNPDDRYTAYITTLFPDASGSNGYYQDRMGVYRFDYSTQAPDDCCLVFDTLKFYGSNPTTQVRDYLDSRPPVIFPRAMRG